MVRKRLLPKDLEVITLDDIAVDVANQYGIKKDVVMSTFSDYLKYLSSLSNDENALVIRVTGMGDFVYSHRKGSNSKFTTKKRVLDMTRKMYEEHPPECLNSVHQVTEPIIFRQGLYHNNLLRMYEKGSIVNDDNFRYKSRFTPKELEFYQNRHFFREDSKYKGNKELEDEFVKEVDINPEIEIVKKSSSHGGVSEK